MKFETAVSLEQKENTHKKAEGFVILYIYFFLFLFNFFGLKKKEKVCQHAGGYKL